MKLPLLFALLALAVADKSFGQRRNLADSPSSLYRVPQNEFSSSRKFQGNGLETSQSQSGVGLNGRPGSGFGFSRQETGTGGAQSTLYETPQQGFGTGNGAASSNGRFGGRQGGRPVGRPSERPGSRFEESQEEAATGSVREPSTSYGTPQQVFGSSDGASSGGSSGGRPNLGRRPDKRTDAGFEGSQNGAATGSGGAPSTSYAAPQQGFSSFSGRPSDRFSGRPSGKPDSTFGGSSIENRPTSLNGRPGVEATGGFNGGISNGIGSSFSGGFGEANLRGRPSASTSGVGGTQEYQEPQGELTVEILSQIIPGGGIPGEDYSILARVPETEFSCDAQMVPGYYADTSPEAGCQVFHICHDQGGDEMKKDSFLCPIGSLFNQQYFVCDWWYNVDCSRSEEFYSLNEELGVDVQEEIDGFGGNGFGHGGSSGSVIPSGGFSGSRISPAGVSGSGFGPDSISGSSFGAGGTSQGGFGSSGVPESGDGLSAISGSEFGPSGVSRSKFRPDGISGNGIGSGAVSGSGVSSNGYDYSEPNGNGASKGTGRLSGERRNGVGSAASHGRGNGFTQTGSTAKGYSY